MRSILVGILLSGLGCSSAPSQNNEPAAEVTEKPTKAVAEKTKDPAPKSLVTLGGNITETVFALGFGEKIVGVDASSLYPEEATKRAQVGYYRQVSAEGIISLAPDLVLASDASGPADVLTKVTGVGIRIEKLPSTKTLEGAKSRIKAIADLLGAKAKGDELIQSMEQKIQSVSPSKKPKKVLFIYARGAGSANVAGTKTAGDEMIRLAGGLNAVQDYEGYKPMNAESIVAAAPDVILLTTRGLQSIGGVDAVAKMEGISLTPAAKNKAIIAFDDLMLLGFGPRTGEAVVSLAELLNAEKSTASKP